MVLTTCVTGLPLLVGCHGGESSEIPKTVAQLPPIEGEVFTVQLEPWPLTVRAQGSLVADELAVVGTKVPGRVAEVHVDLGDVVHSGDRLVTLDREEFELQVTQAEAQLSQAVAVVGLSKADDVAQLDREKSPPVRRAKAIWEEAQATLKRTNELFEQKAINEAELETAIMSEKVAETQFASAVNNVSEMIAAIGVKSAELAIARQRLREATVIAPFDGVIHQRHVAPGSFVPVGQALVTLVRTNRLRFRATMPERHAQRLSTGQLVRLRIESMANPLITRITRISPVVDELSRALLFEAEVDNRDGQIRSGLFAEAEVVLDPDARSIAVPASAVLEFAGVEKVWKVVDGKVQEQIIQAGTRGPHGIEIKRGLQIGDVILGEAKGARAGQLVIQRAPSAAKVAAAPPVNAATPADASTPENQPPTSAQE